MRILIWTFTMILFGLISWTSARAEPVCSRWGIGNVARGQCLYTSLLENQLAPPSIQQIIAHLGPHMDFKDLRPGTAYRFTLDPAGGLQEFTIESGPGWLNLTRSQGKYAVQRGTMHLSSQIATVHGWYHAAARTVYIEGEAGELSRRVAGILLKDLEMGIDLQEGDHFRLVVEKIHIGDRLLRYGPIEAFEFIRGPLHLIAIRYHGDYYDEDGRALKSRFLRFPLAYQDISSQFRKKRNHPILGGVRPHHGIDLAAPVGTPVWAIADGEVKTAGWLGGFGRTVVIRHADGYESLYAHLKGFALKIREGARVHQKQVIGYIGTTGLSTGPHLHYGLTRDGEHRDPLKEAFPKSMITKTVDLRDFNARRERIAVILSTEEQPHLPAPDPVVLTGHLFPIHPSN